MNKRALNTEEQQAIQDRRAFIESLLASDAEEHHTAAEKLTLLKLLFERKQFSKEQEFEIDSMGVLLGDALSQVLGLEWVMVEQENGSDPAVCFPDTTIFSFPIDVVLNRIESDEEVDVFYLFVGIAETMGKMFQSGEYKGG